MWKQRAYRALKSDHSYCKPACSVCPSCQNAVLLDHAYFRTRIDPDEDPVTQDCTSGTLFNCQKVVEFYNCDICHRNFDILMSLRGHMVQVHHSNLEYGQNPAINYVCDDCQFESYSLLHCLRHRSRGKCTNFSRWFCCPNCTFQSKEPKDLEIHKSLLVSQAKYRIRKIPKCIKTEHKSLIKCRVCKRKFTSWEDFIPPENIQRKVMKKKIFRKEIDVVWINYKEDISNAKFDYDKWLQCTRCRYKVKQTGGIEMGFHSCRNSNKFIK